MRIKNISLLVVLTSILFVSFIPFNILIPRNSNDNNTKRNNTDKLEINELKPSASSGKIQVDGDNGWLALKSSSKCTGDGILSDPYIIENLEINAGGSGDAILIQNTNKYFKIQDCTLTGGSGTSLEGAGIRLVNVDNGEILNNAISSNTNGIILTSDSDNIIISGNTVNNNYWFGIHLRGNCDNNVITGNTAIDNKNGIYLTETSTYNDITFNTFESNDYFSNILYDTGFGILITEYSEHNLISNNQIINNVDGIMLSGDCNYNDIIDNSIENNVGYGVVLESTSGNLLISGNNITNNGNNGIQLQVYCDNIDIIGNNIINNRDGIKTMWASSDNTIRGNQIKDNSNFGIDLGEMMVCDNYRIYNNYFINNGQNAREFDHTTGTSWYYGTTGNFWSDYPFTDGNGDGVGDTPYNVPGFPSAVKNQDLYPIWSDKFIFIDDAGTKNWQWASNMYWCSGQGTSTDPYVIKDLVLDTSDFQYWNFILIKNSNVYLRIENCHMTGATDSGIFLDNVRNAEIINSTIVNNGVDGIYMNNVRNVAIKNSNISSNGNYGINMYDVVNGAIGDSIITNNGYDGIFMEYVDYFNITDSSINSNVWGGIILNKWNDYCNILRNSIHSNYQGMYMQHSDHNVISENDIFSHTVNDAWYSYAINTYSADYNLFYKNQFYNNYRHIKDAGTLNYWDNGQIGNYWDDYVGTDIDDDGIGDSAYRGLDNYPIFEDGDDSAPPIINIVKPSTNQICGLKAPGFEISIDGLYVNTTWYSIVGGTTNYTFQGNNDNIDQDLWDGFGDEIVSFRFYVNDTLGGITFDDISVEKDNTLPQIKINSPKTDDLFGTTPPSFNVEIFDSNIDYRWYSLHGGTNTTFSSNTTFNPDEWSNLPNGPVTITFYAIDKGGNENSSSVDIEMDIIEPIIQINSPYINQLCNEIAPTFNIEIDEPHLKNAWYKIGNGQIHTFKNNETLNQTDWDTLVNGSVTIIFWANDTKGNVGTNQVRALIDNLGPIIRITDPDWEDVFGEDAPNFTLDISEVNLHKIWYTLDDGTTNHTFTGTNVKIQENLWDNLPEEIITVKFYANDTFSHMGYVEFNVTRYIPKPVLISTPSASDGVVRDENNDDGMAIPFGNYYLIFTLASVISLILIKKRKFKSTKQ